MCLVCAANKQRCSLISSKCLTCAACVIANVGVLTLQPSCNDYQNCRQSQSCLLSSCYTQFLSTASPCACKTQYAGAPISADLQESCHYSSARILSCCGSDAMAIKSDNAQTHGRACLHASSSEPDHAGHVMQAYRRASVRSEAVTVSELAAPIFPGGLEGCRGAGQGTQGTGGGEP